MKTWLVLDCNYLAHRAYHALGSLSYNDVPTGVLFGVLRDILIFQELFDTNRIVFCFDHGTCLRIADFKDYKFTRRKNRSERPILYKQIRFIKKEILPELGFRNVFYQKGYEADDIIASVCLNLPKKSEAIIISADKDLWQLLSPKVMCYNPCSKKMVNRDTFVERWGINPEQWSDVRAIAGCATDEVPGVDMVGEKTACKFLANTLNPKSPIFDRIVKNNRIWRRNLPLVSLPYPDTKVFKLSDDEVTPEKWEIIADRYGMTSLQIPRTVSKKKKGFGI